ncbi:hypothetical protein [Lacinutrix sp. Hel_I_90]|uniref:hypothetical protein n=1 Tax=Lacinutrix sp. Hel_I_90 TaxID=1249999 RepID=UPI0005C9BBEC|nr:hypothetical protein [Lacinutrix sp. Hel_I_90]
MTVFDKIYLFIFGHYKGRFKQKANTIALVYTSVLQISLLFLLGCFFAAFASQMYVDTLSSGKAWFLFVLLSIGVHYKNWMGYSGQTRKVMNAKFNKIKTPQYNLVFLYALPFLAIAMGLLFMQAL